MMLQALSHTLVRALPQQQQQFLRASGAAALVRSSRRSVSSVSFLFSSRVPPSSPAGSSSSVSSSVSPSSSSSASPTSSACSSCFKSRSPHHQCHLCSASRLFTTNSTNETIDGDSSSNISLPSNLVIEGLETLLEEQPQPYDPQLLLRTDNSEKVMPVLKLVMSEYEDDEDDNTDASEGEQGEKSVTQPQQLSTVTLDNRVFGVPIRQDIVHNVVVWQRARWRTGTAHSKTRAEVRGGGRKPWKQKGTGRARHGSIRSPIWRGGGRAHGKKRRDFSFKLNKKVRRMGMRIALAAKWREGNLVILDVDDFQTHKTVHLLDALEDVEVVPDDGSLMVIDADEDDGSNINFARAASNLPWISLFPQRGANVYAILKHHRVAITTAALDKLTGRILPL